MSCEHGNWSGCELCTALDVAWEHGFEVGSAHARREALEEAAQVCDAEICECCWDADALAAAEHLAERIRALLNASPGSGGQEPSTAGGQPANVPTRAQVEALPRITPSKLKPDEQWRRNGEYVSLFDLLELFAANASADDRAKPTKEPTK